MCEFCMTGPVAKIYAAAPVLIGIGKLHAFICDPDWKACSTCAAMIDQNHWPELAEHVTESWARQDRDRGVFLSFEERRLLKRAIEQMHALIREALGRTA
jgi:hypothetical protein